MLWIFALGLFDFVAELRLTLYFHAKFYKSQIQDTWVLAAPLSF